MSSKAVNDVCIPWNVGVGEFDDTIAATPVPQASSTVKRHRLVSDFHTDRTDLDVKDKISEPFHLLGMVEDVQNLADHVKKCKKQMSPANSNTSSLGILESSFSDFSMSEDVKEIIARLADIPSTDNPCNKLHELGGVQSSEMTHEDVDLHHRLQAALAQSVLDQTAGSTTSVRSGKVSRYSGNFFCRSQSCQGIRKNHDARRSEICSLQNQLGRNPFHSSISEDTEMQFLEFDSQEFISADKVIDQLMVDEADCLKEFADIASGVTKTVDVSCFSGIMGDDEISIRSSVLAVDAGGKMKLRPEEFFGLKTDKIGSIHGEELSDADRPNFGKPIYSPIKGRKQMPLADSSASDYSLSVCDASFPSLTAISNMLGEENEASPCTIAKNIMQYKPEKGGKNILKDVSNCKHLAETSKKTLEIEKPTELAIPLICIDDSVDDTKGNTLEWKLNNQGMTGLIDPVGSLHISMDVPSPKPSFLKELQLRGCVGETKLLIDCESPVLHMESTPEEAVSQTIGVKNGGIVPLQVQVTLTNSVPPLQTSDDCMFLDKSELQLHPDEETSLQITFCPHEYSPVSFEREILLAIQPHGEMYEIPVQGNVVANNPRHSCTSSGSSVLSEKHHNVGYESNNSGRSLGKRSKSVATTHRQLVWGSVPVGKSQTESCSLRNELSYPIKLLMTLFDPTNSYKLLNEVGQAEIQRKITLHAKECLTFSVTFTPLKCGAAFGKLQLSELSPRRSCNRLAIPLYGYGGIAKLNVRHVARDRSGYMWLNFGQLDVSMSTEMTLFNEGNLEAFASISHVPRGAGTWLQSSVSIDPAHLVIGTGCAAIVRINCCLQCDDLKFLAKENNEVIEMGILCITCGDEPTRHRLRRIMDNRSVKKLDPTGKPVPKSLNLQDLCLQFPGESVTDVNILNDPQSATLFLYRTFKQYEVTLTAEKLGDKSFAVQACAGMNDATCSSMFKTICDDVTFTCTSDDSELHSEGMWSVAPARLTLMYPQVVAGCITVNNHFKYTQMFEAVSSDTFLVVEPTSGIIPPKGETLITVTCLSFPDHSGQMCEGSVKVFLENDAKSVMIKIKKNVTIIHST